MSTVGHQNNYVIQCTMHGDFTKETPQAMSRNMLLMKLSPLSPAKSGDSDTAYREPRAEAHIESILGKGISSGYLYSGKGKLAD